MKLSFPIFLTGPSRSGGRAVLVSCWAFLPRAFVAQSLPPEVTKCNVYAAVCTKVFGENRRRGCEMWHAAAKKFVPNIPGVDVRTASPPWARGRVFEEEHSILIAAVGARAREPRMSAVFAQN